MKQTIAELGIGGEGWIIYNDFVHLKRVVHVCVVDNWDKDYEYRLPRYLLREHIESNEVQTTRDLVVFGNEIVYSTKEEAEEAFRQEVGDTITTYVEHTGVNWKKLLSELDGIQKQFSEVTEDQKKDFYTFIKKLKNIADPQPDSTDWNQVRINAAISALNALLQTQTTKHSVLGEFSDIFAKAAVGYADRLVYELKRSEALFEEKLKEI